MSWVAAAQLGESLTTALVEDEKVEKFLSGIAPTAAGFATTAMTGNPAAGAAVGATVGGLSRSHGKAVAYVAGTVVTSVAVTAACVVATPVLIGWGAFELVKAGVKKLT